MKEDIQKIISELCSEDVEPQQEGQHLADTLIGKIQSIAHGLSLEDRLVVLRLFEDKFPNAFAQFNDRLEGELPNVKANLATRLESEFPELRAKLNL